MEEFTSWHRVTKQYVYATISNDVYDDWGVSPWTGSSGTANICSRAKLYKPPNAEVYYEVCALEYTWAEDYGVATTAYHRSALWNCETADNALGSATMEDKEIPESIILWAVPGLGYTVRKRTGDIAAFLTDQNRYVDNQPLTDYGDYWPLSGFLVTHYNLTDKGDVSEPWSTTGCTFDFTAPITDVFSRETLLYTTGLMEGRSGWFLDKYTPEALIHYGEEGSNIHAILLGGEDGGVYQLTGPNDNGSAIACNIRTKSKDQGDIRYNKYYGDVMLDCNTQGVNVTATPGFDNHVTTTAPVTVNTVSRTQVPVTLGASWQTAKNVSLDLSWNHNGLTPELFYIWEPRYTENVGKLSAFSWETSFITHGVEGFFFHGYLYLVHISTSDLTFSIIGEGGTVMASVGIPNSGGIHNKTFVRLPVVKGKAFKYSLASAGEFKVEGAESELLIKQWGYEHLFGDTKKKLEEHIHYAKEDILLRQVDLWIRAYNTSWQVILTDFMRIEEAALHFSQSDYCLMAWPFKDIYEVIELRFNQANTKEDE